MKFTLKKPVKWSGQTPLPEDINTLNSNPALAEFELLSMISTLHGITAFDILIGATEGTEKDRAVSEVLNAFQQFISPKMPLSNYDNKDARIVK
jgi:hypothetical protein